MPKKLSWDEVASCIDREATERYGRYLRGVVETETIFVKPAEPSLVNRTIVLGVVYDWCRRHHRRRHLPAIVRAFAWCARYCYAFHPVFFGFSIAGKDVLEALEWIANDSYSFRFAPAKHAGVLVVGEHKEVERREVHHFAPVHLIAPDIDDRHEVPFDIRMAARYVMEAALRAICVTEDDGSYDEIAIRITARDLLEVAAPLVIPD